jgi:hypothetical protein
MFDSTQRTAESANGLRRLSIAQDGEIIPWDGSRRIPHGGDTGFTWAAKEHE